VKIIVVGFALRRRT